MDKMSIIVRYSRIFSERKLKEQDLSFAEQLIIMFLSAHSKVNQDTISKYYMIDKGAIAKTVGRLETKGFIVRIQNSKNKRENLISLSDKGRGLIESMKNILNEWNAIIYNGMSPEEIETVKKLTTKMAANATKFIE